MLREGKNVLSAEQPVAVVGAVIARSSMKEGCESEWVGGGWGILL